MKFRTKFFIIFIVSILIQGTAIGYFSYYYARNIASKSRKQNISNMVNLIDININSKIKYIDTIINDINKVDIKETLLNDGGRRGIDNNMSDLLDSLNLILGNINSLILVDNEDMYYKNIKFDSISKFYAKHFQNQEILKKSMENPGKLYWSGINRAFVSYTNRVENVVLMSYGLGDNISLGIEISSEGFEDLIPLAQDIFKDQYVFILDKNNNIIASNKVIKSEWIEYLNETNIDNGEMDIKLNDEKYYFRNQYNGVTGWRTFALISNNRIFYNNTMLRDFIIYFVVLSILVFSIMAYLVSYGLTKPLEKLTLAMRNAEKDKYKVQIKNSKKDEIGILTDSFNELIQKINILVNEVYLSKITQKNAEIEALQSQINPHFLYNTLDSINWMLLEKEEYEISNIIISLGDILKYSMDINNGFVPLSDEINNIENYLLIQKNRFEDKLQFSIDIPNEMLGEKVPKLILQPIVENSIIHGVDSEQYDIAINITIDAYFVDENINIEIVDNGVGIDAKKVKKLNEYLEKDTDDLNSIGLKNVNRRIKLYFGEDFGIKIYSKRNVGTKVVITIPREGESVTNEYNNN
ncbi:MAG: histidine kinase [Miniphocaeibacter sp.]|uniref:sensor histidine kinase n=1 Tax=Miniphocaeibacter sp. TaxID=3100973 RepID=UPI003BAEFF2F